MFIKKLKNIRKKLKIFMKIVFIFNEKNYFSLIAALIIIQITRISKLIILK